MPYLVSGIFVRLSTRPGDEHHLNRRLFAESCQRNLLVSKLARNHARQELLYITRRLLPVPL